MDGRLLTSPPDVCPVPLWFEVHCPDEEVEAVLGANGLGLATRSPLY